MASLFTIRGYGSGFATGETRFTGTEHEACRLADEVARSYGDRLYAVVVTSPSPDDIVYIAHAEARDGELAG
jgi:hypothetical protein